MVGLLINLLHQFTPRQQIGKLLKCQHNSNPLVLNMTMEIESLKNDLSLSQGFGASQRDCVRTMVDMWEKTVEKRKQWDEKEVGQIVYLQ